MRHSLSIYFVLFLLLLSGCNQAGLADIYAGQGSHFDNPTTKPLARSPAVKTREASPEAQSHNQSLPTTPAPGAQQKPQPLISSRTPINATPSTVSLSEENPAHPTPNFTPHPVQVPAPIQIFGPGPGSKVISPVQLEIVLNMKHGNLLRIELHGEDSRLLSRMVMLPNSSQWDSAVVSIPLFFEIRSAQKDARLTVSVDDQYGRTIHLVSTRLVLINSGEPILLPAGAPGQGLDIQQPKPDRYLSGGILQVAGISHLEDPPALRVKIISPQGKVLGQRVAQLSTAPGHEYDYFNAEVPYFIDKPTPARLVVYSTSDDGDRIHHLSSIEVMLSP